MANKKIWDKISLTNNALINLKAERILNKNNISKNTPKIKIEWNSSYEINEGYFLVKPVYKFYFKPRAFFSIKAEYELAYEVKEEISEKEIIEKLEDLSQPCASKNTMLIGMITQQIMEAEPYITIPYVDLKGNID